MLDLPGYFKCSLVKQSRVYNKVTGLMDLKDYILTNITWILLVRL